MRLPKGFQVAAVVVLCCALVMVAVLTLPVSRWSASVRTAVSRVFSRHGAGSAPPVRRLPVPVTVMAVGGSSAQGYYDPHLNGYLSRALTTVSDTLHEPIHFVNKAKSGDIPTMVAPKFDPMLHEVHPDVLIISWGLLNSIARKVPEAMFQKTITSEVTLALKEGADVWIVTPLVTESTYVGPQASLEPTFTHLEIAGALAVHSPRVHIFDLLTTMQQYLKDHHMSYKPYVYNAWHLNQAGHVLAGQILANMILKQAKAVGLTS